MQEQILGPFMQKAHLAFSFHEKAAGLLQKIKF